MKTEAVVSQTAQRANPTRPKRAAPKKPAPTSRAVAALLFVGVDADPDPLLDVVYGDVAVVALDVDPVVGVPVPVVEEPVSNRKCLRSNYMDWVV